MYVKTNNFSQLIFQFFKLLKDAGSGGKTILVLRGGGPLDHWEREGGWKIYSVQEFFYLSKII